eukprot:gene11384-12571_t
MPKIRELSYEERLAVKILRETGLFYPKIGRIVVCHHSTALRIYKIFQATNSVKKLPRTERDALKNLTNEVSELCARRSEIVSRQKCVKIPSKENSRTIPDIGRLLRPLMECICDKLIPTIFGCDIPPDLDDIISMPTRLGGLGIGNIMEESTREFQASKTISAPLAALIVQQRMYETPDPNETEKCLKTDKGASNWLVALPLEEERYVLNKEEFRDALCLRYDLPLKNLPSKCPCNQPFTIPHAMTCKKGGFVHIRHDELRNLEAGLLNEVCRNVAIEPRLLPLTGEVLSLSSANTEDNARLDIKARGFFREGQTAYFDIRVTNLKAPSYQNKSTETVLKNAEQEKKRSYN